MEYVFVAQSSIFLSDWSSSLYFLSLFSIRVIRVIRGSLNQPPEA